LGDHRLQHLDQRVIRDGGQRGVFQQFAATGQTISTLCDVPIAEARRLRVRTLSSAISIRRDPLLTSLPADWASQQWS